LHAAGANTAIKQHKGLQYQPSNLWKQGWGERGVLCSFGKVRSGAGVDTRTIPPTQSIEAQERGLHVHSIQQLPAATEIREGGSV